MTRILTIEDHASIRQLISLTLKFEGYQVLEAADGDQGISMALAERPDLLLVDVMLPGRMNGWQVCRRIRQTTELADLPIVILTALDGIKDRSKVHDVGANAYMPKPFRPVELINTVGSLLRRPA